VRALTVPLDGVARDGRAGHGWSSGDGLECIGLAGPDPAGRGLAAMVWLAHCASASSIQTQRNGTAAPAPSGDSNGSVAPIERYVTPR